MNKTLAMVALAAAFMISSAAQAATVDIFVVQTTATTWDVKVQATAAVGGIGLAVTGFADSNPCSVFPAGSSCDVTPVDSPNVANLSSFLVGGDLQIVGTSSALPLAPGDSVLRRVAVLTGAGPFTFQPGTTSSGLGFTALNSTLYSLLSASVTVSPLPEPMTVVLLGLGLVGLGLTRRRSA